MKICQKGFRWKHIPKLNLLAHKVLLSDRGLAKSQLIDGKVHSIQYLKHPKRANHFNPQRAKLSSSLPLLSYKHFRAWDSLSGSMNRRARGTIKINIFIAQIYPAETQPRASLNNMHPNLAWTLWGRDQDALTNRSWHTHASTQASGAGARGERTSASTNTHTRMQTLNLSLMCTEQCSMGTAALQVSRGLCVCAFTPILKECNKFGPKQP